MAENTKPAILFARGSSSATIAKVEGKIWFNTTDKTIEVCSKDGNGTLTWEKFGGKLNDATWNDNVLTITKQDGSSVALDFSGVASLPAVTTMLATLKGELTPLITAADEKGQQGIDDAAAALSYAKGVESTHNQYVTANDSRVLKVEQDLAAETARATGVEGGLDTRLKAAETAITNLASATHFIGVKASLDDVENPVAGDIVIVGSKEYIYDPTQTPKWVELGDTTAETNRIAALEAKDTQLAAEDQRLAGLIGDAEGGLTKSLADEVARAKAAEKVNADAITAENERAVAKEAELVAEDQRLASLIGDANSGLTKALDDEVKRAKKAESDHAAACSAEDQRLAGLIEDNANAIAQEIQDRQDAIASAVAGAMTWAEW